ncbi:hypothetical protein GCM10025881_16380 [Pseudolysinimonas kribbensis]|uniref:HTH arsR-type domain-containing protein n=1 Tax=Pseudolysinimonas kribbensis TaxID=433641 RepID=A0ABQ6K3B1_9MICO|nr:metalloregulator ArsR/SmtB family transcription factor [Pseudolysinimonas kribbensis]GMA94814.1 hypothetical protein GCM10025881_16380 [Pseudolysinimonas kribbensis]
MSDIFDVLADGTRRELLRSLRDRGDEVSVSELVSELGISQPTVSKHLKVLRDHDLVSVREEGQHRYYRLDAAPLGEIEAWLAPFAGAPRRTGRHPARCWSRVRSRPGRAPRSAVGSAARQRRPRIRRVRRSRRRRRSCRARSGGFRCGCRDGVAAPRHGGSRFPILTLGTRVTAVT